MAGLPDLNQQQQAPTGLASLLGILGKVGQIPQYQQQMEGQNIDLQSKRLGLQQQQNQITAQQDQATAQKQKDSYDQATQQLNALQTMFKSNPEKWGKDPSFSKSYGDVFKTVTGGQAPVMPDGSLDPSIVKPTIEDLTSKNPKELARIQSLKPGPERDAALSTYAGVTPDMRSAPAIVSDEAKAKLQEIYSKIGHYKNVDEVAADKEKANGVLARARADELQGKKTTDMALATKYRADAQKVLAQSQVVSQEADARTMEAKSKMINAQKMMPRGGNAGVMSARELLSTYTRMESTLNGVNTQIDALASNPLIDADNPQMQALVAKRDAMTKQIDGDPATGAPGLQAAMTEAQTYLTSNLGYAQGLKAASGASSVKVTNAGSKSQSYADGTVISNGTDSYVRKGGQWVKQ
jgi:hypothetical protein